MGDIKKPKKKYSTSAHPWIRAEIEESNQFRKEYGMVNRKEVLIANSFLKKYKDIAKRLIADTSAQGEREKQQMMGKLEKLGLLPVGSRLDDVLSLSTKNLLDRRIQTLVFRKGLARSIKQARQFITHRHITLGTKEINSPSYLVAVEEEGALRFKTSSTLAPAEHPERVILPPKKVKLRPQRDERDRRGRGGKGGRGGGKRPSQSFNRPPRRPGARTS